jgi:catechol 2,3-dioxygenase-like lactoylglutathione lyase family enzyme
VKIDHINIVVADLERAATFYETVFGFKRGFSASLQGEWIETVSGLKGAKAECLFLQAPAGETRIELIRYDAPEGASFDENARANTTGLRHIAFEVEDIDATLAKAKELGVQPISDPVEVPFKVGNLGVKRLAYFHDYDGTLLEAASYQKS